MQQGPRVEKSPIAIQFLATYFFRIGSQLKRGVLYVKHKAGERLF